MGSKELVCYKKSHYMGSVKTCLLQECTLFGVNKDLSVTRMHVIWGQKDLSVTSRDVTWSQKGLE